MFSKFLLPTLLCTAVLASPLGLGHSNYESASGKSGFGSDAAHKKGFNEKSELKGHDLGEKGYSGNSHADEHDQLAKNSAGHKNQAEVHNSGAGSKYSQGASDYNKDVKTKTFGFFDYHYVQPQYHMEQFHTDEKHSDKYNGDEHTAGQKHKNHGGFHSAGHDGYDKAQGKHGSDFSDYGHEDAGHKTSYGDKNAKYGGHSDGYYNKGHDNFGKGYDSQNYEQPAYYGQPNYGYEPAYAPRHGGFHPEPYYGHNARF